MNHNLRASGARAPAPTHLLAGLLFLAFLALYVATAAPSVLSGDSAEFQLAAQLLGVPHPTTYPLYILTGKLATLIIPFGDPAWRVTLVSSGCAALAVTLAFFVMRRVLASTFAATLGALALGLAPGLWNAATMAEVYALLAALLAGLACCIVAKPAQTSDWRWLRLAALLGGLGFTHHGLFTIAGLPLLAGSLLWRIVHARTGQHPLAFALRRPGEQAHGPQPNSTSDLLKQVALLALCFAAGLLPWLYPLVQYARYGPFTGDDYGLPQHYFWGGPVSWSQTLDLLTGGPMRQGIFRPPTYGSIMAALRMVGVRLIFEFGPLGVLLGLLGSFTLLRRARAVWIGAAWMFFATLAYLLLLGPAVQDAPVFTLPMLLPWALWFAAGADFLIAVARRQGNDALAPAETEAARGHSGKRGSAANRTWRPAQLANFASADRWQATILVVLLVATLGWGYSRLHVSSKRELWLFRRFGEATLDRLPANAVVLTHWEQGMTLQYLVLVEARRPDVWIDVVEPNDDDWGARARRRYADRPVFFVGTAADIAGLPVELIRADAYADLFKLRAEQGRPAGGSSGVITGSEYAR